MDFIELPDGVEPEDVPDLGGQDYDNGDFSTYPQRQGWNLRALLDYDIPAAYDSWDEVSQAYGPKLLPSFDGWDLDRLGDRDFRSAYGDWDKIAQTHPLAGEQEQAIKSVARDMLLSVVGSFIQTWIMLGILNVALRRPVSRSEVVEVRETIDENGEKTTHHFISLRAAFAECAVKIRDHIEADADWGADLLESLRIGITFLDDMQAKIPAPERYYLLPRSVELSLLLLLNTLDLHQGFHSQLKLRANMYSCASLEQEMKEQRSWCPHVIYKLRAMGGAQSLYYATLLPRFGVGEIHDRCDEGICVASNIDHATYQTMHSDDCSGQNHHYTCHDVEISECDLGPMFEAGGYPLICLEQGQVKLVRYELGMQYVAISHVWSDGRGNPRQNSLPLCQLRSIQHWSSSSTNGATLFWIDTLCVPIKEPLRNTAIMRMAQTYEAASHVIVLSKELLMHRLPASHLQTLYMIFYSKWMTRLWTLQEAVLARKLLFQFQDQAVTFSALSDEVLESQEVPLVNEHSQSRMAGLHMLTQMRLFEGGESNHDRAGRTLSLKNLIWAWQPRTSSRLTDATICASIVMGRDLRPILAAPDHMKMQAFWACQDEMSIAVLWARGPRLEQEGFRWAPQDLLHPLTRQSLLGEHVNETTSAVMTNGGLMISGVTAFLLEEIASADAYPPKWSFDFCSMVIDGNTVVGIYLEEGSLSWAQMLAKGQLLLLLDEFEYTKAVRRACVALPLQSIETVRGEEQPITVQYLLNAAIEVREDEGLSSEEQLRPAVKIVEVFESSQSWLMT